MNTITKWALGTVLVIGSSIGYEAAVVPLEASASEGPGTSQAGYCDTFVGGRTIIVCVPDRSDSGAPLTMLWEDGSAAYQDGRVFDPDTLSFR